MRYTPSGRRWCLRCLGTAAEAQPFGALVQLSDKQNSVPQDHAGPMVIQARAGVRCLVFFRRKWEWHGTLVLRRSLLLLCALLGPLLKRGRERNGERWGDGEGWGERGLRFWMDLFLAGSNVTDELITSWHEMQSLILALLLPMLADGFCPAGVTTPAFRPATNAGLRARHGINLSGMRMQADGVELPGTWVLTAKYEVRHGCLGGGGVTAVLLTV